MWLSSESSDEFPGPVLITSGTPLHVRHQQVTKKSASPWRSARLPRALRNLYSALKRSDPRNEAEGLSGATHRRIRTRPRESPGNNAHAVSIRAYPPLSSLRPTSSAEPALAHLRLPPRTRYRYPVPEASRRLDSGCWPRWYGMMPWSALELPPSQRRDNTSPSRKRGPRTVPCGTFEPRYTAHLSVWPAAGKFRR